MFLKVPNFLVLLLYLLLIMHDFWNTLRLLRLPFSFLLMPVFLFALSQVEHLSWSRALWTFLILHLLVYPASNGYNSYVDKDEGSIGGLEKPPLPTDFLFFVTLFLDLLALILAYFLLGISFMLCLLLYIVASRAYSSRMIRLKKYPIGGFLVVMIFQGGFTYYLSLMGLTADRINFDASLSWVLLACSFQIAGVYPLTQIYQHQQDLADGVVTLSYRLGYRGTFVFSAVMFALSNLFYYQYFASRSDGMVFYYLQLFFLPIIGYFGYWMLLVWRNSEQANFKHTMRMNLIAALSLNSFFIYLIILRHYL